MNRTMVRHLTSLLKACLFAMGCILATSVVSAVQHISVTIYYVRSYMHRLCTKLSSKEQHTFKTYCISGPSMSSLSAKVQLHMRHQQKQHCVVKQEFLQYVAQQGHGPKLQRPCCVLSVATGCCCTRVCKDMPTAGVCCDGDLMWAGHLSKHVHCCCCCR